MFFTYLIALLLGMVAPSKPSHPSLDNGATITTYDTTTDGSGTGTGDGSGGNNGQLPPPPLTGG